MKPLENLQVWVRLTRSARLARIGPAWPTGTEVGPLGSLLSLDFFLPLAACFSLLGVLWIISWNPPLDALLECHFIGMKSHLTRRLLVLEPTRRSLVSRPTRCMSASPARLPQPVFGCGRWVSMLCDATVGSAIEGRCCRPAVVTTARHLPGRCCCDGHRRCWMVEMGRGHYCPPLTPAGSGPLTSRSCSSSPARLSSWSDLPSSMGFAASLLACAAVKGIAVRHRRPWPEKTLPSLVTPSALVAARRLGEDHGCRLGEDGGAPKFGAPTYRLKQESCDPTALLIPLAALVAITPTNRVELELIIDKEKNRVVFTESDRHFVDTLDYAHRRTRATREQEIQRRMHGYIKYVLNKITSLVSEGKPLAVGPVEDWDLSGEGITRLFALRLFIVLTVQFQALRRMNRSLVPDALLADVFSENKTTLDGPKFRHMDTAPQISSGKR
ncbi:hypothetical protein ACLOJK_011021 [Asimina triloba]